MVLEEEIRRLREEKRIKSKIGEILKPRYGWKSGKESFWHGQPLIKKIKGREVKLFISGSLPGLTNYVLQVNGKTIIQKDSLLDREAINQIENILRSPSRIVKLAKLRKVM